MESLRAARLRVAVGVSLTPDLQRLASPEYESLRIVVFDQADDAAAVVDIHDGKRGITDFPDTAYRQGLHHGTRRLLDGLRRAGHPHEDRSGQRR